MLRCCKKCLEICGEGGFQPELLKTDNEHSKKLIACVKQEKIDLQVAPPGAGNHHSRNISQFQQIKQDGSPTGCSAHLAGSSQTAGSAEALLWLQQLARKEIAFSEICEKKQVPAHSTVFLFSCFSQTPKRSGDSRRRGAVEIPKSPN